jgi:hypothetical protein
MAIPQTRLVGDVDIKMNHQFSALSAKVSFALKAKSRCDVCLQKSDADRRLAVPHCDCQ